MSVSPGAHGAPTGARTARVHVVAAAAPDDVRGLKAFIADGTIDPAGVRAILGKTEGNGCVNDFTRALAARALHDLLRRHVGDEAAGRVCLVMSGGTEGALSPHWLVLEVRHAAAAAAAGASPALAIGTARTADLSPEHLGRLNQVDFVTAGVRAAMADAGIDRAQDVHFVQVKCPLLTQPRMAAARARGAAVASRDTLASMGLSRGASALGVAVALGEVERTVLTEEAIGAERGLFCSRASASAGVELLGHEIVVLGMSERWAGPLRIDHAVMADMVDLDPVRGAADRLGLPLRGVASGVARLVALLAKAEASKSGHVRGARHTMLEDSDVSATRHARAFVGGALAGLFGTTTLFVSGGAEHQGPDGGGPVALIAEIGGG